MPAKRRILLPIASSRRDKASLLLFAKAWHRYGAAVPIPSKPAEAMAWYWLLRWAGAPA